MISIPRDHLVEKVAVSDVCDKHGIQPSIFYRWQRTLFENGAPVFTLGRLGNRVGKQVTVLEDNNNTESLALFLNSSLVREAKVRQPYQATGQTQEDLSMATERNHIRELIDKLETLPPERINEVEDFIDFIKQRDQARQLTHAAMRTAEPSLKKVWDNPDDAIYDAL